MESIISPFSSSYQWTWVLASLATVILIVYSLRYPTVIQKSPSTAHGYERAVKLMAVETTKVAFQCIAVSAITFYEGDVNLEFEYLKTKVLEIVKLNPWLLGKLVKHNGEYHLLFNNSCETLRKETFCYAEDSSLDPKLDGDEVAVKLSKFCVKIGIECLDKDEPLWRVTLIKISDRKFALLFSICHTLADGHTFYKLHNMISRDVTARALIVDRQHEFAPFILCSSTAKWFRSYGIILRFFLTMFSHQTPQKKKKFAVNQKWIETEKAKHEHNYLKFNTTDPTYPSFISTNDTLTSWYFQVSRCNVGLMAINFRNRFPLATDDHAGNYEGLIAYQPIDFTSPDLIRRSVSLHSRFHEHIPLPGIWDTITHKICMITSWVSFYHEIQLSSSTSKHLYHMPVVQKTPNEALFEKVIVFCPRKGDIALLTFALDHSELCPPSE